MAEEM